jgi:hypothetical protein
MYLLIQQTVEISKWEIQSTLSDYIGIRWGIPGCHGSGWNISILWDVMPCSMVEVADILEECIDSVFRVQE